MVNTAFLVRRKLLDEKTTRQRDGYKKSLCLIGCLVDEKTSRMIITTHASAGSEAVEALMKAYQVKPRKTGDWRGLAEVIHRINLKFNAEVRAGVLTKRIDQELKAHATWVEEQHKKEKKWQTKKKSKVPVNRQPWL